jgi:predicted RNA-binding Zn ribbon-like protein
MGRTRHMRAINRVGGVLCLEYINTVGEIDQESGKPVERLNTYEDLLVWSIEGEVLSEAASHKLGQAGAAYPDEAARAVYRAQETREMLYRLFRMVSAGEIPASKDLNDFNLARSEALAHTYIAPQGQGFAWAWRDDEALDRMLHPVIRSAAELLTSPDLSRIKACVGTDCRWLSLDMSKNKSRRWCDMNDCGNRHKARRHYQKRRVSM